MPSYATLADLIAAIPRGQQELIDLTDRTGSGQVDEARVTRVLEVATSRINTYVARVATLPLSQVPAVLRDITTSIARYELWGDTASEEVRKRYEDAIAWLRDLVVGRADLGVPPAQAPTPQPRSSRGAVVSGYDWSAYSAGAPR